MSKAGEIKKVAAQALNTFHRKGKKAANRFVGEEALRLNNGKVEDAQTIVNKIEAAIEKLI